MHLKTVASDSVILVLKSLSLIFLFAYLNVIFVHARSYWNICHNNNK